MPSLSPIGTAFDGGIAKIVGFGAFENMARVKACGSVAGMKPAGCGPAAIGELKGESMGADQSAFVPNMAISEVGCAERPEQAFIRIVGLECFKEPLVGVFAILSAHRLSSCKGSGVERLGRVNRSGRSPIIGA